MDSNSRRRLYLPCHQGRLVLSVGGQLRAILGRIVATTLPKELCSQSGRRGNTEGMSWGLLLLPRQAVLWGIHRKTPKDRMSIWYTCCSHRQQSPAMSTGEGDREALSKLLSPPPGPGREIEVGRGGSGDHYLLSSSYSRASSDTSHQTGNEKHDLRIELLIGSINTWPG